jgi:hypothetical protein
MNKDERKIMKLLGITYETSMEEAREKLKSLSSIILYEIGFKSQLKKEEKDDT